MKRTSSMLAALTLLVTGATVPITQAAAPAVQAVNIAGRTHIVAQPVKAGSMVTGVATERELERYFIAGRAYWGYRVDDAED